MRAVLQRVNKASVSVNGETVGHCQRGWFLLLGITHSDTMEDIHYLLQKIITLRGFGDEQDRMNLSLQDIKGELLVISQFTLFGDLRKGRRPGFSDAAPPDKAKTLYDAFIGELRKSAIPHGTGVFGAKMIIETECDGPVTFFLDSTQGP